MVGLRRDLTHGHPHQSLAEITAIGELARNMSEPPLDFTEWYFPPH